MHVPSRRLGNSVFLLLRGRVKVCLISRSGLRTILRIHLPSSLIGMSSLGSNPFRDGTATPLEPVTAVELTNGEMRKIMSEDSGLALRVMRILLDRLTDLHSRLADLQATSVEQRLARLLLALGRNDPNAAAGERSRSRTKICRASLAHADQPSRPR